MTEGLETLGLDARRRRLRRMAVLVVLLSVAVTLGLGRIAPPLRVMENAAYDMLHLIAYPRAALSTDIAVVTITEETLAALPYRSPVDRAFLAGLIENLAAAGPRGIALDLLFDRPSEPAKDAMLAEALARERPFPVVAATAGTDIGLTEAQAAYLEGYLTGVRKGLAVLIADPDDGVVRDALSVAGAPPQAGLSLALLETAPADLPAEPVPMAYQFSEDLRKPRFPVYPAHVAGLLPKEWLAGRYILIGADLPHSDRHPTPLGVLLGQEDGQMPGVMIHAHVLQQLLDGRQTLRPGALVEAGLTVLLAALAALAVLAPLGILPRGALVFCLLAALWIISALLLRQGGVVVPAVAPSIAAAVTGIALGTYEWLSERRQRQFVRDAFNRYVAPTVVEQLIANPWRMRAAAERRPVSCIFTDVAGFTSLTERTNPEVLSRVLNAYLSGMTDLFFAHQATLDKFVGDAVVGFLGGPIPREDHARTALTLARDLDVFADDFARKTRETEGIEFGITRIGVHTGEVLIGNFGGDRFFDYTVIGDAVNTAARLEAANKHFGTRICASGTSLAEAPEVPARPIGRIVFKGKTQALKTFELLPEGYAAEPLAKYVEAYGLLDSAPEAARRAFEALAEAEPDDPLIWFHLQRLTAGETGTLIAMKEK